MRRGASLAAAAGVAAGVLVPFASPAHACTVLGTATAEHVVVALPAAADLGVEPVAVSTANVVQRRAGTSSSTANINGVAPTAGPVSVVGRTAEAVASASVTATGVSAAAQTVAENLLVKVGTTTIEVVGLRVRASRSTDGTPQASTSIEALVVNGQAVAIPPAERTVPLGSAGSVRLFSQSSGADHAEAVAVRVVLNGVADVTIGRALAQAFRAC